MQKYTIDARHPHSQFLSITWEVTTVGQSTVLLQLPAWRPGRYELQNFPQLLRNIQIKDENGVILPFMKKEDEAWQVEVGEANKLIVTYDFYADKLDAGGSWLSPDKVYINWINCIFYIVDRQNEQVVLDILLPQGDFDEVCTLEKQDGIYYSYSIDELVDSPFLASTQLTKYHYKVQNTDFYICLDGAWQPQNLAKLIEEFRAFTTLQLEVFEQFPTKEYYFIVIVTPHKAYHGVEHLKSTLIVLGEDLKMDGVLYNELLGVSSHELYHVWNIKQIRPKEMYPYDFTKENYFPTGYVAEGVTTYLGDLFLRRSKVFDNTAYLKELNTLLLRYSQNRGGYFSSLVQSSYELWIDGYKKGIPARKVSIYTEGAILALITDLTIIAETKRKFSLDTVMKDLLYDFSLQQKGYSHEDYWKVVGKYVGERMANELKSLSESPAIMMKEKLKSIAPTFGIYLQEEKVILSSVYRWGIKLQETKIAEIHHLSPAYNELMIGDEIMMVNDKKATKENIEVLFFTPAIVKLSLIRAEKHIEVVLHPEQKSYFETLKACFVENSEEQILNRNYWLGRRIEG